MKNGYLCLLLAAVLLTGCANGGSGVAAVPETTGAADSISGETKAPDLTEEKLQKIQALGKSPSDQYRTFYEVFVYSFRDSDGDGIGDLNGVTEGLDYLQQLGVTGIWLMPVHPSPSYHKYDVTDYYAIDPAYGTMEDFENLIRQCHSRDIRVIMDLVLNHTSDSHPDFQKAAACLGALKPGQEPDPETCPSLDFYNFQRADSCPAGWNPVPGAGGWFYESRFSPHMPDVNFGSEALRQEQKKIMAFWTEKGVDGFRLDAAKEFYTGQTQKNLEVLNWIQTTARELNPDCCLVAEVWDSFMSLTNYYESGITSLFNYAFGGSGGKSAKVLRGAGDPAMVSSYAVAQEKADTAFRKANPDYIDAPFFSNHDVGRIAGFVGRDENKTKLAGAMNLFMSGSSFIYYGEELGMVAGALDDPSYRAPMYWNAGRDQGTTEPPPGCTLPEAYPFGSLEEQEKDPASVYNYYRQAAAIRNAIPAIARGIPTAETELNRGCVSACRKTWGEEICILLLNISGEAEAVDLRAYEDWKLTADLSATGEPITLANSTLQLPGWGAAILTPGED